MNKSCYGTAFVDDMLELRSVLVFKIEKRKTPRKKIYIC